MGALLVVHLYQLYDYRMLPVVQSTVYAGGAYDSQDIEGAIVELLSAMPNRQSHIKLSQTSCFWWNGREHFYFTAC